MKRITILLLMALAPIACGAANGNPVPKTAHPMKIGIIGTGDIGGALARHWGAAGHQLLISSRHPEQLQALAREIGPNVKVGTPREAAAFGDVVLVSVPYFATPQVGRDYAAELRGKVVLDTGNPYPGRDGDMAVRDRKRGTGVASAEYLPGTRLVRAFNAINSGPLANQAFEKPERLGIPLAARRSRRHGNRRTAGAGCRFRPGGGRGAGPGPRIRRRDPGLRARNDGRGAA